MHHMHEPHLLIWVMSGCGAIVWCWDVNLGPLQGQPVCLITKPSFQPSSFLFLPFLFR